MHACIIFFVRSFYGVSSLLRFFFAVGRPANDDVHFNFRVLALDLARLDILPTRAFLYLDSIIPLLCSFESLESNSVTACSRQVPSLCMGLPPRNEMDLSAFAALSRPLSRPLSPLESFPLFLLVVLRAACNVFLPPSGS